jgi:DNA polymerase
MLDLWEEVKKCKACDIAKLARNKCFGDGLVEADIVLVGEGPGMDEDASGNVFVGNAGRILTNALKAANLDRKRLFICNVVKCHPPKEIGPDGPKGNRAPTKQEARNCWPFLKQQMKILEPKFVIAMGNSAASMLLNEEIKVTRDYGRYVHKKGMEKPDWWVAGDATVIVTFHPQYVGYREGDQEIKDKFVNLFRKVKELAGE